MFAICTKMIDTKEDAEDVLHNAFIIAFNNINQLKNDEQFGGWLKRITINECIKHCKKKLVFNDIDNSLNIISQNTEKPWWQNFDINLLYNAINTLPNGSKQIFYLYAIENYDHKQIAAQLNISESTSKTQYHRAKQLLKQQLSKYI